MTIETNKWYSVCRNDYNIFKNEAERDTQLQLNTTTVDKVFADTKSGINVLYLIITSDGVLHYRTSFSRLYMDEYTVYNADLPVMTKLEVISDDWLDETINEMVNNKENNMIKDLLHNRYNELKTKLDKSYEENKEAIIADSELYKAAKKIVDIVKKVNINSKVNINDIVNVNLYDITYLSKDQQIALDETYNAYWDEVIKLQNKFQELETLLDLADTYEQKHDLLVKYEIIKD